MSGMISFDRELNALAVCEKRATLIARNLANSNTPEFKSQDLNFHEAMQQVQQAGSNLEITHPQHINLSEQGLAGTSNLYYRVPMEDKEDGNTVDNEIERKNFIENSLRYQTGLGFVERKASQILKAIRGE